MSKFNTKKISTKTVNLAGGEAFQESPKLELVSILLTSFVKDSFYRSEKGGIKQLKDVISQIGDKKFVGKAAVYARNKFGMRSISHLVAAELAEQVKGQEWTKAFFDKVVHRPDDMTEILALYRKNTDTNSITNPMKKGFASALQRFDEYQLEKYLRDNSEVNLLDVVNVSHPAHTVAIKKLIKGTLKKAATWENKLSEAGREAEDEEDKAELKGAAWAKLIETRRLGYFALLKNLRNIIKDAPDSLDDALEMLTDKTLIKKSLVLPFRYTTAYQEIANAGLSGKLSRQVLGALNQAVDIAVSNVPELPGNTAVVLDISGSMGGKPIQIGSLFAAVLAKANNADIYTFASRAHSFNYNREDSTITIADQLVKFFHEHSGGTDFNIIFPYLKQSYDRVIILSDMQGWIGYYNPTKTLRAYETKYDVKPWVYSFDLAGYGTLQFPEARVAALAGFSEKIFDVMKLVEQDKQALINEINKVIL